MRFNDIHHEHNLCLIGQDDWLINIGLYVGKISFVGKLSKLVKEKTTWLLVAIEKYYQT